jgi:2-keto-4-pentenoate hydratase/2-oxohepta-3-ene-1,7-dioic acid hydratase in catechol pathway
VLGLVFGTEPDPDDLARVPHLARMMTSSRPHLFVRPGATLVGPGAQLRHPRGSTHVVAEAEIAVVVGRECHDVAPEQVWDHVAGVTVADDLTAGDFIVADGDFVRGKGQPATCALGTAVVTGVTADDLRRGVRLRTLVGGELRGEATTAALRFPPEQVLSQASRSTLLRPGDAVLLGCVAPVRVGVGDVVTVCADGIGELTNQLVEG